MKQFAFLIFLCFNLVTTYSQQVAPPITTYTNPILRGVNPDPSICRVGNDYYMVTSSMFIYPGVPIYHSKDLVNWQQIGYCLTKKEHFFLDKNNRNPMMYAATLRYNKGTFYMITTDVHGGGNFLITTTNPAGEWSNPVFIDQPVFDPSLFFDTDGKVYYTRRGLMTDKDIVQAEIDVTRGKLLTPLKPISKGLVSDDTEGPHLFKANGWYYLTMGEGGSRALHMQTIARSKSPWGPFVSCPNNPVISQHNGWWHPLKCMGHADFLQAHDGSWWAVCLGTRHAGYNAFSAIGRETYLLPVTWVNEWPVVNPAFMQKPYVQAKTLPLKPWPNEPIRDNFDNEKLNLKWKMLAYPTENYYSLTERKGYLRLKGNAQQIRESSQAAFIGTPQKEMAGNCTTQIDFKPTADNEEAGLSVFQTGNFHYDVFITIRNNVKVVVLRKSVGDLVVESKSLPITSDNVRLQVVFDGTKYTFQFSENDGDWKTLGTGNPNLISTEIASVWSGVLMGMYSSGNGKICTVPADFNWFDADFKYVKL